MTPTRTLYWRAIRRVQRRTETFRRMVPLAYTGAPWPIAHCADCDRAQALIREAARLVNALAVLA